MNEVSEVKLGAGATDKDVSSASNATPTMAEGVRQLLDRISVEKENLSAQEVVLDGSNIVQFPGFPYGFEASIEKILVSVDIFKSGYECKVCLGKGTQETKCVCDNDDNDRPGYRYNTEQIKAIAESPELGIDVATVRSEMRCQECKGDYPSFRKTEACQACEGKKVILHLPNEAENLPTTGVVVSVGSQVPLDKINYRIGDRVLFGQYAGNMIPTKAGLMFKILDWNQVHLRITGADDLSAFDFIITDRKEAM